MGLPDDIDPPEPGAPLVELSEGEALDMITLTDLAFPGFFRQRTCEMGSYFGIRPHGDLIAMCGERITLDHYAEISGLCTHPAHRGQGYAPNLIWQVVRKQRATGDVSWMHVGAANQRAVDLYLRMGFQIAQQVTIQRVALR